MSAKQHNCARPEVAPSLEQLAQGAQRGDAQCLEELGRQVREPLRAFLAQRIPKDMDADDIAQETLLRAFKHLDAYDSSRSFRTWLFTIGKRLAVNTVVAEQRRIERNSMAYVDPHSTRERSSDIDIWGRAQAILSNEAYRALWMRYERDASVKEVAADLGRSVVSTKVLLFRARKRLLLELRS